ncbi:MAG: metallophosphoesterase [Thermoleophilia bacterium]|nr:metallophosphoesterase [Thermoleophilia bacterium]
MSHVNLPPADDDLHRRLMHEQRVGRQRQRRHERRALGVLALAAVVTLAFVVATQAGWLGRSRHEAGRAASTSRVAAPRAVRSAFHFSDDFEHGDPPAQAGWTAQGTHPTEWRVTQAGWLEAPTGGTVASMTTGTGRWRDVRVVARVAVEAHSTPGIIVRASADGRTGYRARWLIDEGRVVIERADGSTSQELASVDIDTVKATSSPFAFAAIGDRLTVVLDGHAVLAATDTRYPAGRVGVASFGGSRAAFDAFDADVMADSFTVAVLPDTQFYVPHRTAAASAFTAQARWLAQRRAERRIAFALHEGDVVNDLCSAQQWRVASFAMSRLDGKLPYAVAPGNKDTVKLDVGCAGSNGYAARAGMVTFAPFNHAAPGATNFPPQRQRAASPTSWGGSYTATDASASYHLFDATGVRFLVITLPWGPTDRQLAWALRIARRYDDRVGMLVTHDLLGLHAGLRGSGTDTYELPNGSNQNNGAQIWSKLVSVAPNIRFTFNGHVTCRVASDADCTRDGAAAHRTAKNAAGKPVYQMLANYQSMRDGGEGYLRLLTISPATHVVRVETFSPVLDRSMRDPTNAFTLRDVDFS